MKEVHSVTNAVAAAIDRSASYLFSCQRSDGSWCDELSSSAIATGTSLVALFVADRTRFTAELQKGAQWLRQTQHADGGWGDAVVDVPTLNGTAIAVGALQLIDPEHSRDAVKRGRDFLERQGGLAAVADVTRCSLNELCLTLLALAGLCDWKRVRRIPLGIILLPTFLQRRVSFTLPAVLSWGLWHARSRPGGLFRRTINRIARPKALRWLASVQEANGGMEEAPIMVATVVINLLHANTGHDIVQQGITYLLATRRNDGSWAMDRDLEFSVTNLIASGLAAAGFHSDTRLQATREWMLRCQQTSGFAATACPEGGWSWGLPSGWPNTDDTGNALASLASLSTPHSLPAVEKGIHWLLSMQNRDGSWACFVRNGFVRRGLVSFDEACPAFTAHAIIGLYLSGYAVTQVAIQKALLYFQNIQRRDGSIHCIWYRNYVSGTAFVLEAYATLGMGADDVARKCQQWLLHNQNEDGSWGSSRGEAGTVEETSWALTALLKHGCPATDERMKKAVDWLLQQQTPGGNWLPGIVGMYYNTIKYSSDHIANGSALKALGCSMQERDTPSISSDLRRD